MFLFNVRVYGILVNHENKVLISDEQVGGVGFTKFPGGGLEYGEGLIDALKREYMEECEMEIDVIDHLYTTDFFEKSSFNESQIISVYYRIKPREGLLDDRHHIFKRPQVSHTPHLQPKELQFRLLPVGELTREMLTFKTDQVAWQTFINHLENKTFF